MRIINRLKKIRPKHITDAGFEQTKAGVQIFYYQKGSTSLIYDAFSKTAYFHNYTTGEKYRADNLHEFKKYIKSKKI